tara:strand:- start:225 stop:794 length:570 start_codon:yes stop_codon:yes gene_type:complete
MLDKELRKFGRRVVNESKKNLKKNKVKDSNLAKSMKYSVKTKEGKTYLVFKMNEYWEYVDAGVRGVGGTKADYEIDGKTVKGEKWKLKKVTNSKYRYRQHMPPASAFSSWVVRKRLAPRNKKGQFTTRKSMMFAIAKSVYHTGLKTTNFFTDAFYDKIDTIADDLGDALVLDIENRLEESLANDNIIIK